jgi:hypothetical protein
MIACGKHSTRHALQSPLSGAVRAILVSISRPFFLVASQDSFHSERASTCTAAATLQAVIKDRIEASRQPASMVLIPTVLWAQRKACIYITIDLQDAKGEEPSVQLAREGLPILVPALPRA